MSDESSDQSADTRFDGGSDVGATRYENGAGANATRHDGHGVGVGRTRLDGPVGPEHRFQVPPELRNDYEVVTELRPGGEADVAVIRRRDGDGGLVVLKLYRGSRRPDPAVLQRVRALPSEHVVRLLDWGESAWGAWEMLEYVEYGSLEHLLEQEGPQIPVSRIHQIVKELFAAFDALHAAAADDGGSFVLHGDVKPSNIFVRTTQPLDLVLGDWGLARLLEESRVVTSFGAGSIPYQAPESLEGEHSPKGDWWALGIIVAEAALGHHPIGDPATRQLSERTIKLVLAKRGVPLDGIEDERLRVLCTGLLIRDPDHRWGSDEVRRWIAGESPPVAEDRGRPIRVSAIEPFIFAGERCETPEALAPLFARHWDEAMQLISGSASEAPDYVRLEGWLREHQHTDAVRVLEQSAQDRSFARRLFRLIHALDPEFPPTFRGYVLDRDGLLNLARGAASGDEDAQTAIYDIYGLGILAETARRDGFIEFDQIEDRWRDNIELLPRIREQLGEAAASLGEDLGAALDDEQIVRAIRGRILAALLDGSEQAQLEDEAGDEDQPALTGNAQYREIFQMVRGNGREPVRSVAALLALRPAQERYEHQLAERRAAEAAEASRREAAERAAHEARERRARAGDLWLAVIFGGLVGTYAPASALGYLASKSRPLHDPGPQLLNALGDKQSVLGLANWVTGSLAILAIAAVTLLIRRLFFASSLVALPAMVVAAAGSAGLLLLLPTARNAGWVNALDKIGSAKSPAACTGAEGAAYRLKTGVRQPILVGPAPRCQQVTRLAHRRGKTIWRRWMGQIQISRIHRFNSGRLVVGGTWGAATRVEAVGLDPLTGRVRWRSSCRAPGDGAHAILFGAVKGVPYVRLRCASNERIRVQPDTGRRTISHVASKKTLHKAAPTPKKTIHHRSATTSSSSKGNATVTRAQNGSSTATHRPAKPPTSGRPAISGGVGGSSGSSVSGGVDTTPAQTGSGGGISGGVGP